MFKFPRPWGNFLYGRFKSQHKQLIAVAFATSLISFDANAETIVIAALGDSLTHGYGLPQEEGLIPQLQLWLNERNHDIKLINAGVSGDTTAGGLSRIEWTLTPDVNAVIVELGGNDMLRGHDPADTRKNLSGILSIITNRELPVLLVGLPAPQNFGTEFKSEYDAIFPELSTQFETLLYPDFFGVFRRELTDATALETYMQRDAIHPNALGISQIVPDIAPLIVELSEIARK